MSPRPSPSIRTLLATFLFTIPALAQTTYIQGTFQAAISASTNGQNPDLTSAASAVCPANFPQSCSSIGEAGFCCPPSTFCQYAANKQVGCCSATSGLCSGSLSGGDAYQATSQYVAPAQTTTYQPQYTSANNGGAGGAVVAGNNNPTTTIIQQGGFCTTLVAQGGNLPTTANARCGTALVVEAGASDLKGRGGVVGVVLGLQVLGAWVVVRRW